MMRSLLIFIHLSTQLALCFGYAPYVCKDSYGAVYVKVDLAASFNITYKMYGNLTGTACLKLKSSLQVECQSNETTRSLAVQFPEASDLSRLIFSFSNKNASAFLDSVSVTYIPEGVNFPNSSQTESRSQVAILNKYLSSNESSYFCPENQTINMSEIIMSISYLRIQAFGVKNGAFSSDDGLCGVRSTTTGNPTTTHMITISSTTSTTTSIPVTSTASYDNNIIVVRYSNESVCLLMDADINLNFTFNGAETWYNGSVHYPAHGLSEGVVLTNGYCGNDSNWLNISWIRPNDTVTLGMMFKKDGSSYHLDTIVSQYFVDATATDLSISHLSAEVFSSTTSGLNLLKTSVDSYFCQRGPLAQELNLNGVLTLQNFTIQAFMDAKHNQIYGQDDGSCNPAPPTPAPTPAPDHTIPIIVGSSLAGLLIVIVISFVVINIKMQSGYKRLV